MSSHDIVVIGASTGGVEALIQLARKLPSALPAASYATGHFPSDIPRLILDILNRNRILPANHLENGEVILPGSPSGQKQGCG